jgi:hypothetical protein
MRCGRKIVKNGSRRKVSFPYMKNGLSGSGPTCLEEEWWSKDMEEIHRTKHSHTSRGSWSLEVLRSCTG